MIIEKGNCSECGKRLIDYDQNYSNGVITLCASCFEEFTKDNHVIVAYCPACVENGNDDRFYIWKGLDQFLKDKPCSAGYRYMYSEYNEKQGHIMEDSDKDWWVIWIVHDKTIMEELSEKLPRWKAHRH